MEIDTLRSFSPVLVFLAFVGVCWWAFAPKRRKRFEEAAQLPFADEPNTQAPKSEKPNVAPHKQDSL